MSLVERAPTKSLGSAAEDAEVEPEGVEPGEERADQAGGEERSSASPLAKRRDDAVLRPEAREDRNAGQRERADQERDVRARHERLEAAHLADVLLAAEVVDHEPALMNSSALKKACVIRWKIA